MKWYYQVSIAERWLVRRDYSPSWEAALCFSITGGLTENTASTNQKIDTNLNRHWVWWTPVLGFPASGSICSIYLKATQLFIPSYSSLNILIQALWFQGPHVRPLLFPNNGLEKPYTCGDCAGNWRLRAGEIVSPREEHTNCLANMKWAALKTHIWLTLHRLNRLYLCMYMYIYVLNRYIYVLNEYVYTYMYIFVWLISKKRDREFEREQGGVNGRIWREGEITHYNLK